MRMRIGPFPSDVENIVSEERPCLLAKNYYYRKRMLVGHFGSNASFSTTADTLQTHRHFKPDDTSDTSDTSDTW